MSPAITPLIQPLSLDEDYLDETAPLLDRGSVIATEIKAAIRAETAAAMGDETFYGCKVFHQCSRESDIQTADRFGKAGREAAGGTACFSEYGAEIFAFART